MCCGENRGDVECVSARVDSIIPQLCRTKEEKLQQREHFCPQSCVRPVCGQRQDAGGGRRRWWEEEEEVVGGVWERASSSASRAGESKTLTCCWGFFFRLVSSLPTVLAALAIISASCEQLTWLQAAAPGWEIRHFLKCLKGSPGSSHRGVQEERLAAEIEEWEEEVGSCSR